MPTCTKVSLLPRFSYRGFLVLSRTSLECISNEQPPAVAADGYANAPSHNADIKAV